MGPMSQELVAVLARFHHEVVLPDIERVVSERISAIVNPRFDEIDARFDALLLRFDRLETQYRKP